MKRLRMMIGIATVVLLLPVPCFSYNYWVPAVTAAGSSNPGDSSTWKYSPWRPGQLPLSYLAPVIIWGNDAECLSYLPSFCGGNDFIPANLKSGYYKSYIRISLLALKESRS